MSAAARVMADADRALREARQLLTVAAAARRLEMHPETIRRWIRDGKIPALRYPSGQFKIEATVIENIRTTTCNTLRHL